MKNKKEELKISDFLHMIAPMWWLIAIVAIVFAAVTSVYSVAIKDDTYSSSVTFMVSKKSNNALNSSDRDLSTKLIETYEYALKTEQFGRHVEASAKMSDDYKDSWNLNFKSILKSFTIKQEGDTELFTITVTTKDTDLSYFLTLVIQDEVTNLHVKDNWPYKDDIEIAVIDSPAGIPEAPNSKNTVRNAVIAFLLGAVVSIVCVFAYCMLDVTIHSRKKIEDSLDVPVLGVIPRFISDEEEGKANEK